MINIGFTEVLSCCLKEKLFARCKTLSPFAGTLYRHFFAWNTDIQILFSSACQSLKAVDNFGDNSAPG
jgi:hypothetical protein